MEEKAAAAEADEIPAAPAKEEKRTYTSEEHLLENTKLAEMIKLAYTLDLDVIRDFIDSNRNFDTIMPIMNPTRYRIEGEGLRETLRVAEAAYNFARVAVEARDKAPEINRRAQAFKLWAEGEW